MVRLDKRNRDFRLTKKRDKIASPCISPIMKSAYELAMERLAADGDDNKPLTDEQKAQLSQIDEKYQAKIAEREIFLKQKLVEAESQGQISDAEDIRKQLSAERSRLEDEREEKKEAVRNG